MTKLVRGCEPKAFPGVLWLITMLDDILVSASLIPWSETFDRGLFLEGSSLKSELRRSLTPAIVLEEEAIVATDGESGNL